MKYLILISLCLSLFSQANIILGQSKYEPGYIVTNANDTIYGQIRDRSPEPFGKIFNQVRMKGFWIFEKRYSPQDIISYTVRNNSYESLWFDSYQEFFSFYHISTAGRGEKVFMRLSVDGKLKLYWDEYRDADSGYDDSIPYFKKENSDVLVRVTQGILGFKKKKLSTLFSDCPDLLKCMYHGGFSSPEQMALFYNSKCMAN